MTIPNKSEDKSRQPRKELTLEMLAHLTLLNLSSYYLEANPEKSQEDFIQEFLNPIGNDDSATGDSFLEQFKHIQETDKSANLKHASMVISLAYCLQSMQAYKTNERELAWSYMADARYWCGVTLASKGIEDARQKTIVATKKDTSKNANEASHAKDRQVKEEAFKLAREKCPKNKKWPSRLAAAGKIESDVQEYAEKIKNPLSKTRAKATISGWLREMPDAASLFEKVERQRKPK